MDLQWIERAFQHFHVQYQLEQYPRHVKAHFAPHRHVNHFQPAIASILSL